VASSLDAVRAAGVTDALNAVATLAAATSPMRLRQMTAQGSATAAGTELGTSAGYTGGTGAPSLTFGSASTTTGQAASTTAVTITNMPAATIVAAELYDSNATTQKRTAQGSLTASKTTSLGDTLSYAIGAVTDGVL
jgi:hypothetical protein